ncbi:ISLre2 family transposase, partial [Bacilli bacterium]
MNTIISKISELLKDTNDLIDFEEHVQIYVYDLLTKLMGSVFTQLNQTIKRRMQSKGWTVEREDEKTIQFIFGAVRFTH